MRLREVKVRGVSTAFKGREVVVDFDAIPEGIIAVTGDNGSGKTTFLECSAPATLHRTFPSYGESFADHVVPGVRDARSEVTFALGASTYRAVLQADPMFGGGRGKTEGFLYRDGQPVAETGRLVDYDAAVAPLVPPLEVWLSSVFAAQNGTGSFFELSPKERKELFVRLLGLEHLQVLSEQAAEREKAAVTMADRLAAEVARLTEEVARLDALDAQHQEQATALEAARGRERDLRAVAEEAAGMVRAAEQARQEAEGRNRLVEDERRRVAGELAGIERELADIGRRIAEAEAALGGATPLAIQDAVDSLPGLRRWDDEQAEVERQHAEAVATIRSELAGLQGQREGLLREHQAAKEGLRLAQEAQAALAGADVAEETSLAARGRLAEATAALTAATAQVEALEPRVDAWRAMRAFLGELEGRVERATAAAAPLRTIPGVPECAGCPLTEHARAAVAAGAEAASQLGMTREEMATQYGSADLAEELAAARAGLARARQAEADARRAADEAEAACRRYDAHRERAAGLPAAEHGMLNVAGRGQAVATSITAATDRLAGAERALQAAQAARANGRDRLAAVTALADRAPHVAALAQLNVALDGTRSRRSLVGSAAMPEPVDLAPFHEREAAAKRQHEVHVGALADAEVTLRAAEQALARTAGAIEAIGNAREGLGQASTDLDGLRRDAREWALIAKGLGRDGAQALEIDAAGPAVTELANQLLSACYGDRFALRIVTTQPKKTGGTKEVFEVQILDAEQGRYARRGSGGEMVILDEALRLAIAIYNTRVGGYELRTLWRDETAGALSPDRANKYVAMLRRARELGGFHHVLFITHQPDVWAQADARLHFSARGVVVVREG